MQMPMSSGGKQKMSCGMVLNLFLLLSMVITNLLSLYHLSSSDAINERHKQKQQQQQQQVPEHLLRQLHTIRATIAHLTHLRSSDPNPLPPPPPELVLYSRIAPIASACADHPELLRRFMSYSPFSPCPDDLRSVAEPLLLRGCHPLPRRRCFSPTPTTTTSTIPPPTADLKDGARSALDLTLPHLLRLAETTRAAPIRLGLDVGGGDATLAALLKLLANATVVTTTMDLGAPNSEAAAMRGMVPLHAPLQQRFPVGDGTLDLVRAGHAVNRWIPVPVLEFLLYDCDRVLRPGGLLWVDHFFCKKLDMDQVYAPMLKRLGYRIVKWAVADKTDAAGLKNREAYLTALLQKPFAAA